MLRKPKTIREALDRAINRTMIVFLLVSIVPVTERVVTSVMDIQKRESWSQIEEEK